jgi:hypothetical protein
MPAVQVELLVVEFADFDASLAVLADAVARGEAGLLNEDELDRLAVEIPDMRTRLGIRCAPILLSFLIACVFAVCAGPAAFGLVAALYNGHVAGTLCALPGQRLSGRLGLWRTAHRRP